MLKTIGAGLVGGVALTGSAAGREHAHRGPRNHLTVVAKHPPDNDDHYVFDFDRPEIPAGWTTFVLENEARSTHIGYTVRLTEAALDALEAHDGDTIREQYMNAVNLPFQAAWDPYGVEQDIDVGTFFGLLFEEVDLDVFMNTIPIGGPGLIGGERSSKTTQYLEPGTYMMECYVLDTEGVFHTTHGMVEPFEVTDDESKMDPPDPTLEVTISTDDGIVFAGGDVGPGRHTIAVTFEDNQAYGHGLGHDVHLIRLDGDTDVDEVNAWMDYLDAGADFHYADRGAFTSTGDDPGPETWIGGVQDIFPPAGESVTAYIEAGLGVGEYALVAEVPDPAGKGMLESFTVSPAGS